jgi:hypothetical protein
VYDQLPSRERILGTDVQITASSKLHPNLIMQLGDIHNKSNPVEPESEITIKVNNEKLNHECNDN